MFMFKYADQVDFIVDSSPSKQGQILCYKKHEWIILSPEEIIFKDVFVVICVKNSVNEIKRYLIQHGKEDLKDFCTMELYRKKLVLVHGNCHILPLKTALRSNSIFSNLYAIYDIPTICELQNEIDEYLLKQCDVFIHEDIRKDNPYGECFSDEYILFKLKEDCINITIPNLFGQGDMFYPFFKWNPYNNRIVTDTGFFPMCDEKLIQCYENKLSVAEIVETMSKEPYSRDEIVQNFENRIAALRKRERDWDFPVTDFILNNYKEHKLFYDIGHPTNYVMSYIACNVLKILGIKCDFNIMERKMYSVDEMGNLETYIYPCVMKALEMVWDNSTIREYSQKKKEIMDFPEYIKEFVEWCNLNESTKN